MLRDIFVEHSGMVRSHAHPMDPLRDDADIAYEAKIVHELSARGRGLDRLDFVLLGMGDDAHTASLFPRTPPLRETRRLVRMNDGPGVTPPARITMTFPLINASRFVAVLVVGRKKRDTRPRGRRRSSRAARPTRRPSTTRRLRVRPSRANSAGTDAEAWVTACLPLIRALIWRGLGMPSLSMREQRLGVHAQLRGAVVAEHAVVVGPERVHDLQSLQLLAVRLSSTSRAFPRCTGVPAPAPCSWPGGRARRAVDLEPALGEQRRVRPRSRAAHVARPPVGQHARMRSLREPGPSPWARASRGGAR